MIYIVIFIVIIILLILCIRICFALCMTTENLQDDLKINHLKIFTMVKDEVDIIEDWVRYHASIFGYDSIFVIDNFSTDGTYEVLKKFQSKGIHLSRKHDYKLKGYYMQELISRYCDGNTLAFPIDSDEFIILYKDKQIITDKTTILDYLFNLPTRSMYKANYITSIIPPHKPEGYDRATTETEHGYYIDMGQVAKTFIYTGLFKGKIDHGNHISSNDYMLTDIALIHFPFRNNDQLKSKSKNNVLGLGYPDDLVQLKNIIKENPNCSGCHNVKIYIDVLENNINILEIAIPSQQNVEYIPLDHFTNYINNMNTPF